MDARERPRSPRRGRARGSTFRPRIPNRRRLYERRRAGTARGLSKRSRMRRRLLLVFLAAMLTTGTASVASADSPRPDPNVAGLQTALAVKGFYHGPIDGIRGPLTSSAVRAFQRHAQLASTSVVNGRTLSALGPLGRPGYGTRSLHQGLVGRDVAALQFELRYHGFPNRGRGVFDASTTTALKKFQRYAGVRVRAVGAVAGRRVGRGRGGKGLPFPQRRRRDDGTAGQHHRADAEKISERSDERDARRVDEGDVRCDAPDAARADDIR